MKKITFVLLSALLFLVSVGFDDCDGPSPTPIPQGGFKIRAYVEEIIFDPLPGEQFGDRIVVRDRNRTVTASWQTDRSGAAGNNRGPINQQTDQFGDINVNDGRSPATWRFGESDGACAGQFVVLDVERNKERSLTCFIIGLRAFNSFPFVVNTAFTPQMITVTGDGMSAAYGMPVIRYFDLDGNLIAHTFAEEVAWDGTWLTASTTDLSGVASGNYSVMISNKNADGTWASVGATSIEVFHYTEPPPDPEPCGYETYAMEQQMDQMRPMCDYNTY